MISRQENVIDLPLDPPEEEALTLEMPALRPVSDEAIEYAAGWHDWPTLEIPLTPPAGTDPVAEGYYQSKLESGSDIENLELANRLREHFVLTGSQDHKARAMVHYQAALDNADGRKFKNRLMQSRIFFDRARLKMIEYKITGSGAVLASLKDDLHWAQATAYTASGETRSTTKWREASELLEEINTAADGYLNDDTLDYTPKMLKEVKAGKKLGLLAIEFHRNLTIIKGDRPMERVKPTKKRSAKDMPLNRSDIW